MPHIVSAIESVLFVASRPLTLEKITQAVGGSVVEVEQALQELSQKYNDQSGVVLIHTDTDWQLVSHKDNQTVAEKFLKAEVSEELTRPQLETLTVISYCGPLTRAELEQIRGVNCSLILRNLMMRGRWEGDCGRIKGNQRLQRNQRCLRILGVVGLLRHSRCTVGSLQLSVH
jgi:segregation and condensation protein B